MDQQPDPAEKTEQPTPKKIEDALNKGNTPFSREAPTFASLLGMLGLFAIWMVPGGVDFATALANLMASAATIPLNDGTDANALFVAVYGAAATFAAPVVFVLMAVGVAAALAQNPPRAVGERVRPKLERISINKNAKRIFGSQAIAEFMKALFKFGLVGIVAALILADEVAVVIRSVFVDPTLLPEQILDIAIRLVAVISVAIIVLVAADLAYTRLKWKRDLKMSRREVKEELKQSEGDPLVRARVRAAQKDRSRRRMLDRVPTATVVITNPTHYAVALAYERGVGGAPIVVAKGLDQVALRIRVIAGESDVPIIENPPLARSLYAEVEVDRMIPEAFYRAVAEVLHYIYSKDEAA